MIHQFDVEHFRKRNSTLADLMEADNARTHPMVLGELACGTPPAPRVQTLDKRLDALSERFGVRYRVSLH